MIQSNIHILIYTWNTDDIAFECNRIGKLKIQRMGGNPIQMYRISHCLKLYKKYVQMLCEYSD